MLKKITNLAIILIILWAVNFFLFQNVAIKVTEGNQVTAIICAAIIFCAVVIPFTIGE
jgi:hypothetical protein